jgi:nitronate monooxygenase
VNLFVPGARSAADLSGHRERMLAEARLYGVEPGDAHWDDDGYPAKLALVVERRIPVVSFTSACPRPRMWRGCTTSVARWLSW